MYSCILKRRNKRVGSQHNSELGKTDLAVTIPVYGVHHYRNLLILHLEKQVKLLLVHPAYPVYCIAHPEMLEYKFHLLTWNAPVTVLVESSERFFIERFLIVFFLKTNHQFAEIIEGDLPAPIVQFVFYILKLLLGRIGSSASHGF